MHKEPWVFHIHHIGPESYDVVDLRCSTTPTLVTPEDFEDESIGSAHGSGRREMETYECEEKQNYLDRKIIVSLPGLLQQASEEGIQVE